LSQSSKNGCPGACPAPFESLEIVLVSPRNPLNIGAVARAMANFGFAHLTVVAPYDPHWLEARSAVGAETLLQNAKKAESLAEAVAECSLVLGTGTLTYRKAEQRVVSLPSLASIIQPELEKGGRVALVFGPEKHGLTCEDLSWCNVLVEIPTDPRQPSMNLGQAVAVCLYELSSRSFAVQVDPPVATAVQFPEATEQLGRAHSGHLDLLAGLIEETMAASDYSPRTMQAANRHDLRLLLRRLAPSERDTRRILGLFRRILWRLERNRQRK
jgi:tRNA/rRNA methyltransferase